MRGLKVCLDTQHSFAAGYDLTTGEGIEDMLAQLDAGPWFGQRRRHPRQRLQARLRLGG